MARANRTGDPTPGRGTVPDRRGVRARLPRMLDPKGYTDEQWLDLMIEGLEAGREGVPGGPPPEVQARFVGWSGADAMRECFGVYRLVKDLYPGELAEATVLDFGVGWGRLIRLFAHDVPEARLHGCDVDPEILQVCRDTGVPGTLVATEPGAPLPYDDGTFDLAYAYSVFSHLSEDAAKGALAELARVVRPGGQLTFTTQGTRFLDLCVAIRRKRKRRGDLSQAEETIDAFFANPRKAQRAFDKGRHAYTGVGGTGVLTGDFYGWAAIPERWLRQHATGFDVAHVADDPAINEQVVFTLIRS
jgi:SAM-dependent methyltransferase